MSEREQPWLMRSYAPPSMPRGASPIYAKKTGGITLDMLERCLFSYIYVWTKTGKEFWMYPVSLSMNGILFGYQWDNGFWNFAKLDALAIDSFY
jgi:hypothetical protein